MKHAALPLALALAACGPADGYRFEAAEFDRDRVVVTVVAHPSQAALLAEALAMGVDAGKGRELQAFGIIGAGDACTIHIVEPARAYRPEWIGHEFTHCIKGRWHD